jgi:hypothetical protein
MKMNKIVSTVALLAITGNVLMAGGDIAPVEPVVPEVVASNGWEYSASIYLFMPSIDIETAKGEDLDLSFSDILDNLNFTFMGTLGAQKGKWGFLADVIYMDLEDGINYSPGPLERLDVTSIGMKSWVVTPMVTYRVMESDQLDLDLLAGARYLYIKIPIDYTTPLLGPGSTSRSNDVWDGIVGARGTYDLNEKWFMQGHLDVGTGDTEVTWQAFAGVGYKYENFDLIAGYRHLEWDFDNGDTGGDRLNDLSMSGPIIGAKFNF